MNIVDVVQGSAEWHAERCGKATASRVADITARTKTGWGASRANYAAQLIAERLTGHVAESYTSAAMQWGNDVEPQARAAYAFVTGEDVTEVGFVRHPKIAESGASPDGLIGEDGLVQIKCPHTSTHIASLLGAKIPDGYVKQILWEMACTGRAWCDFCSFDPRMPADMQLFIKRVDRDEARIAELEREVEDFLAEVEAKVEALRERYELGEAA